VVEPNEPIAIRCALVLEANGGGRFVGDRGECSDGNLKANHAPDIGPAVLVASHEPRAVQQPTRGPTRATSGGPKRALAKTRRAPEMLRVVLFASCRVGCYARQAIVLFIAMVRDASR
jgi:hypothetical protein